MCIFNDRLSQLLLGHNVSVSLTACGITATNPCDTGDFDLVVPSTAESCTFDNYWGHTANYLCRTDVNQAFFVEIQLAFHMQEIMPISLAVAQTSGSVWICMELHSSLLIP